MVWTRGEDGPVLSMDARGERFVPPVHVARARIAERDLPVFTYAESPGFEDWTVARAALVREGSRWLPVRHPEAYAGDVFRTLAAAQGIDLPEPVVARERPEGQVIAIRKSDPLAVVLKDMLRYSTNLTAEAVGMTASASLGVGSHAGSVDAMVRWFEGAAGAGGVGLVDHSGLGGASRITSRAMVGGLVAEARAAGADDGHPPGREGEARAGGEGAGQDRHAELRLGARGLRGDAGRARTGLRDPHRRPGAARCLARRGTRPARGGAFLDETVEAVAGNAPHAVGRELRRLTGRRLRMLP
jgi:hypothetical protein